MTDEQMGWEAKDRMQTQRRVWKVLAKLHRVIKDGSDVYPDLLSTGWLTWLYSYNLPSASAKELSNPDTVGEQQQLDIGHSREKFANIIFNAGEPLQEFSSSKIGPKEHKSRDFRFLPDILRNGSA